MGILIALATLVVALLGVVVAMYFGVIDTRASKRQERQDREDREWQLKHETVALQLSRINPHLNVLYPDNVARAIYADLFPHPAFRRLVEAYIVQVDGTYTALTPRKPTPHELRSPALRGTVMKAAAALDDFRRNNPAAARLLNG